MAMHWDLSIIQEERYAEYWNEIASIAEKMGRLEHAHHWRKYAESARERANRYKGLAKCRPPTE